MRSNVEIQGDTDIPIGKSAVRLLTSNSTLEPMLVLERSDKLILVTAARPPVLVPPPSYSLFGFFSYFQRSQPTPNLNPYELSIETFTGSDIPKQAGRGKLLRAVIIDNECADSFEHDMLNAALTFTKYDNACSLTVNLLRKCTDQRIKQEWVNAIFDVDNDTPSPSIVRFNLKQALRSTSFTKKPDATEATSGYRNAINATTHSPPSAATS
ncbi:hypothetical protein [Legionella tunisiensis]|uniref:hypothetical protein n=1 Tax=Legionella tunisiensis TaxID=1034944 RepID=UPI0002E6F8F3|nr:hypothetical protein [Legionella tunisiensis]